ncbi:MAG: bifunctional 4-hydroxy-3-methylbut-2-enyl diphosphate reductase/30S ribosomal protein S1 [Tissierellia bacterium]|nr:bifunctional 4-hydroxy-3-methylbut-2-enyl diphosphate reductase/30S ribosomal protein S1 [Tissierellia bacterium]
MKKFKIIVGDPTGFCFGVKRALSKTDKILKETIAYSYGELIHNTDEINRLESIGLKKFDTNTPVKSKVILRSHGTIKSENENLSLRYEVEDMVCPFVKKIHKIVNSETKRDIIIIGDKNHPEVKSIISYCNKKPYVLSNLDELKDKIEKFDKKNEFLVVFQTTYNAYLADNMIQYLRDNKINIIVHNTICNATNERQAEARRIAALSDAVVVLGDKLSSNSNKLYNIAKEYCENVYFINRIKMLDISQFYHYNIIGIIAGASTPDWIIKEAIEEMENYNNNEMMEAIESSFTKIRRGDIVKGKVIYVNENDVSVNINYRADGIITRDEITDDENVKTTDLFKPGDIIDVYVMKMDDGDGNVVLSYKRVQALKEWDELEEKFNNEETVTAHITEVVKGGLKCKVGKINAFMPASHVSVQFKKDLSGYPGKDLDVKIIDIDKYKKRLVVSAKLIEEKELEKFKEEFYSSINDGDIVEGIVRRITNFGAFVDIGGIDGLVHITEIAWNRVNKVSDVLSPNDKISVKVLKVDPENDRISLSLKQTMKEPWVDFIENYEVGDILTGKVINLLSFGAFVRLDCGVDGLLHVSQIANEHVEKPSDVLEIGEEVMIKIIGINRDKRKISLSIKELLPKKKEQPKKSKPKAEPRKKKVQPKEPEYVQENFSPSIGEILKNSDLASDEAKELVKDNETEDSNLETAKEAESELTEEKLEDNNAAAETCEVEEEAETCEAEEAKDTEIDEDSDSIEAKEETSEEA